jgi:hypothetical protein
VKAGLKYKTPERMNIAGKGIRGLSHALRLNLQAYPMLAFPELLTAGLEDLKPGEEVKVAVSVPALAPNSDVKAMTAKMAVVKQAPGDGEGTLEHNADVDEVERDAEGNETTKSTTFNVKFDPPTLPRNLMVRLDGGEVFWTLAGDVTPKDDYRSPDMAEHVNAYLDKLAPGDEKVVLKFLVKSDTPGQVKIAIDEEDITQSLIQTQAWPNELDDTLRFDRNLDLRYGATERLELDLAEGPAGAVSVTRVRMDIGGEFGEGRLLGSVSGYLSREFLTVSTDYSVAQAVVCDAPIKCSGVSGCFSTEADSEIYIEIQEGAGEGPVEGSPLAKVNLTLPAPSDDETGHWCHADFDTPADLVKGKTYWVVMKGIQGRVRIGLGPPEESYLQEVLVSRGGYRWKGFRPPGESTVSQLRLVYLPEIDNQTAAIDIGIENTAVLQKLEPGAEVQGVALDIPDSSDLDGVTLLIKSHAHGTLSIANVIQEYSPA